MYNKKIAIFKNNLLFSFFSSFVAYQHCWSQTASLQPLPIYMHSNNYCMSQKVVRNCIQNNINPRFTYLHVCGRGSTFISMGCHACMYLFLHAPFQKRSRRVISSLLDHAIALQLPPTLPFRMAAPRVSTEQCAFIAGAGMAVIPAPAVTGRSVSQGYGGITW